jgi:hypothetical protein
MATKSGENYFLKNPILICRISQLIIGPAGEQDRPVPLLDILDFSGRLIQLHKHALDPAGNSSAP